MMHTILAKHSNFSLSNDQLADLPLRRVCFLRSIVTWASATAPSLSTRSGRMSSTSATKKNEYLVIIPDHPDSLQKRVAIRDKHLENIRPHVEAGNLVLGGAILSKHPKKGEKPDMTGSTLLIKAESEEAVRELIAADAYAKCDVWNVSEAKIYPFRSVIRTAI